MSNFDKASKQLLPLAGVLTPAEEALLRRVYGLSHDKKLISVDPEDRQKLWDSVVEKIRR